MKRIKDNMIAFIISIVVLLIPMIVGIVLWNALPDEIPGHWDATGEVDRYDPKWVMVFLEPVMFVIAHLFIVFLTAREDVSGKKIPDKAFGFMFWILPVISIFVSTTAYVYSLGYTVNVISGSTMILGIIYLVFGNYMPKTRKNNVLGFKIKTALESSQNWEHTSRFAGWLLCITGIVIITFAMLSFIAEIKEIVLLCVVIGMPFAVIISGCVYSYVYSLNHSKEAGYYD